MYNLTGWGSSISGVLFAAIGEAGLICALVTCSNVRFGNRIPSDKYVHIDVHQRTQSNPDDLVIFYRTMLCICYTSHGPVSVRPSQVGVLLKRLNIGSHKQHHTIVRDFSFLKPKISTKFDCGHPLRGRQKQVGWVKIVDFRQITGYISNTAQDRRMVSIKVE